MNSKVTIHTITYNEEVLIGFFITHYRNRFPGCRIVVHDNFSTDSTIEIAKTNDCEVIQFDTNNTIMDSKYLEIKNNCWKNDNTDWSLICDCDELLHFNENDLIYEESKGVTIIKSEAYNMVNMENNFDLASIKHGSRCSPYDKSYIFKRSEISTINYSPGAHSISPVGKVKYSDRAYVLCHYKCINPEYQAARYEMYAKRLSEENRKNRWAIHYQQSGESIKQQFYLARTYVTKVID